MTRIGIMFIAGALAIAAFFAIFYVVGVALGAIVIPLLIAAALVMVVYLGFKFSRRTP